VGEEELLLVHSPEYLQSLAQPAVVARAVEVPLLSQAPQWLLDSFLLQPMRWATAGTILAGEHALRSGLAFNLGGGFHHAKPASGEGFSIYNDIAVMIQSLRSRNLLSPANRIAYIDLDAHLGNGVAWCFRDDPTVFMFDMHNGDIYPTHDARARQRVDCLIPLELGCNGPNYLEQLQSRLPGFLDSISRSAPIALAIYNAGTDVLANDELGGMSLSMDDVLRRDRFVLQVLRSRQIPAAVVTSGGYSRESYQAIARMIANALTDETEADSAR
jgi:histone deacetylase 11